MKNYIILGVLSTVMIGALIYAFTSSGSPLESRGRKFDQTRETNLRNLKYSVDNYYGRHAILPEKLADVFNDTADPYNSNSYYKKDLKDPETDTEYEYHKVSNTSYQLCANFSVKTKSNPNQQDLYYGSTQESFEHPQGHHCFDLKVNQSSTSTTYNVNSTQDSTRINDISQIHSMIQLTTQDASASARVKQLCANGTAPCYGSSLIDSTAIDGSGWVKVNVKNQASSFQFSTLPKDPINDTIAHYAYCSDGKDFELDTRLESTNQQSLMVSDGGDDTGHYELGSKLTLIGPNGICDYALGLTNTR